jgi:hypothetical protein
MTPAPGEAEVERLELKRHALGQIVNHTSDEDSSIPDCGIEIGLGNGKTLYIGEASDNAFIDAGLVPGSWAICLVSDAEFRVLAAYGGDWPEASEIVEEIASAIRAAKSG